jgi:hypothetical protein
MGLLEFVGLKKKIEDPHFEDHDAVVPPPEPYKTWAEMYYRDPRRAFSAESRAIFESTELDVYYFVRNVGGYDTTFYVRDALRRCLRTRLVTPAQVGKILQDVYSRYPLFGGDSAEYPLHHRKDGFVHQSELKFANIKKFVQLLDTALKVLATRERAGEVNHEEVIAFCQQLGSLDFFLWLENGLIDLRKKEPAVVELLDDADLKGGTYWSDKQRLSAIQEKKN